MFRRTKDFHLYTHHLPSPVNFYPKNIDYFFEKFSLAHRSEISPEFSPEFDPEQIIYRHNVFNSILRTTEQIQFFNYTSSHNFVQLSYCFLHFFGTSWIPRGVVPPRSAQAGGVPHQARLRSPRHPRGLDSAWFASPHRGYHISN